MDEDFWQSAQGFYPEAILSNTVANQYLGLVAFGDRRLSEPTAEVSRSRKRSTIFFLKKTPVRIPGSGCWFRAARDQTQAVVQFAAEIDDIIININDIGISRLIEERSPTE
jgi:hypothetical protein